MNCCELLVLTGLALGLAGCSGGLLSGRGSPANEPQIAVGNQLALPPDLALRPPGQVAQSYQAPRFTRCWSRCLYSDAPAAPTTNRVAALPKGTQGDVYAKYGISTMNPDGTKKSDWVLREELRQAVLAEKRKSNPRYGTIFNAGELFNDK